MLSEARERKDGADYTEEKEGRKLRNPSSKYWNKINECSGRSTEEISMNKPTKAKGMRSTETRNSSNGIMSITTDEGSTWSRSWINSIELTIDKHEREDKSKRNQRQRESEQEHRQGGFKMKENRQEWKIKQTRGIKDREREFDKRRDNNNQKKR